MKSNEERSRIGRGAAICAALLLLAGPASAVSVLNLNSIDTSQFGSIAGAVDSTLTSTYDFVPTAAGGDGQITSTVYNGVGSASGLYVYTYQIELNDADASSVGAVIGATFKFTSVPSPVAGVGEAFFVDDGSGNVAPDLAFYDASTQTMGFRFIPVIQNGQTSFQVGLFSAVAPEETLALMIDSGAAGGQTYVLSNGAAPVPEPGAALVFALGFAVIAGRCRTRA
jgi:hypothetical protein